MYVLEVCLASEGYYPPMEIVKASKKMHGRLVTLARANAAFQ